MFGRWILLRNDIVTHCEDRYDKFKDNSAAEFEYLLEISCL